MTHATANDRVVVIHVGLDLVSVEAVAEALHGPNGERYLTRVYTDGEIADCRTSGGVDPARLAGRFAAKEAALKSLSIAHFGVSLRDIEVRTEPSGGVRLALHGRAARLAAEAGVIAMTLSLTHERGLAAAIVVADRRASPG